MLIAGAFFIVLLVAGVAMGELDWRGLLGFVLTAAGLLGAFVLLGWPSAWYTAVLAGLDVVLVLWVFKGNLSLR
jgi:hypothetical protein